MSRPPGSSASARCLVIPSLWRDFSTSEAIQTGRYIVRQQDLPMVQIYQCDLSMTRLCVRQLSAGETNGRYGVQPVMR